ncbi:MAG: hypothetical protein KDB27_09225, partial [Planctomycetales bacterium]|nr:hypothetical protein [Planctomycetales bacterium]
EEEQDPQNADADESDADDAIDDALPRNEVGSKNDDAKSEVEAGEPKSEGSLESKIKDLLEPEVIIPDNAQIRSTPGASLRDRLAKARQPVSKQGTRKPERGIASRVHSPGQRKSAVVRVTQLRGDDSDSLAPRALLLKHEVSSTDSLRERLSTRLRRNLR